MSCVSDLLLCREQSSLGIYLLPYFPHKKVSLISPKLLWPSLQKPISEYIYIKFGNDSRKGNIAEMEKQTK